MDPPRNISNDLLKDIPWANPISFDDYQRSIIIIAKIQKYKTAPLANKKPPNGRFIFSLSNLFICWIPFSCSNGFLFCFL